MSTDSASNEFTVYPAIDVRDGRVVRLRQGDYAQETRYGDDPCTMAEAYAKGGAEWLHLVDLDAARVGGYTLAPLLRSDPRRDRLRVQTGGGVRSENDVEAILDAGADRVVVGSLAVRAPGTVAEWIAHFGAERIAVALDTRKDANGWWRLPVHGWTEIDAGGAGTDLASMLAFYNRAGLRHLLCTDIERDGMLSGPNCALYERRAAAGAGRRPAGFGRRPRRRRRACRARCGLRRGRARPRPAGGPRRRRGGAGMLSRRIIPCLDVRDGLVVKGVRFREHVVVGAIEELALRYRDEGADELVFYDITASPQERSVDRAWVERVARIIDIPFCVAGGIRSVADARAVLHAGADKISVNSPALRRPDLIAELADAFGSQCVVAGIDSLRDADGDWRVRRDTGDAGDDAGAADPHPGLDRRSAKARRRRDRAQLHGQRWRARGLRPDPARGCASGLPGAAGRLGRCRKRRAFRRRVRAGRRRCGARGERLPRRQPAHPGTQARAAWKRHRGAR